VARRYVRLLRDHIEKENGVLFPLADAVLDESTQAMLRGEFQGVADQLGREASQDWAQATLDRLSAALTG
jgi:hemerythrin-like domain-containing protein